MHAVGEAFDVEACRATEKHLHQARGYVRQLSRPIKPAPYQPPSFASRLLSDELSAANSVVALDSTRCLDLGTLSLATLVRYGGQRHVFPTATC